MTTPDQPGWYDDPKDPKAQRYWDGQEWTPHRQRKPASPPAQPSTAATPPRPSPPPPSPPSNVPPPSSSPPNVPPTPPPPPAQPAQSPSPGQSLASQLQQRGTMIAIVAVVVLLAAAGVWAYNSASTGRSTSSSSAPTEAPHVGGSTTRSSAPTALPNAADNATSSSTTTAPPDAGGLQCKITVDGQDIISQGCGNTFCQRIPGGPPGTDINAVGKPNSGKAPQGEAKVSTDNQAVSVTIKQDPSSQNAWLYHSAADTLHQGPADAGNATVDNSGKEYKITGNITPGALSGHSFTPSGAPVPFEFDATCPG
jgi:pyruvate/2-oxoglutarate dehydrogenase complex dihydrolipoamide acyltransferase (E2) component